MTEVWVVRYDQGLYVFSSIEVVEASIKNTLDADYVVEKEVETGDAVTFSVSQDGKIQDRIFANMFSVYAEPTTITHIVYEDDRPPPKRAPRKEF